MSVNRLADFKALPSTRQDVEKEGWLYKKKKKRYFVLSDDTLIWFTGPLVGEAKGSLDIKDYNITVGDIEIDGTKYKELHLLPKPESLEQGKVLKEYSVYTDDEVELSDWARSIKKVKKQKKEDSGGEPMKQGWMEKKGRKRWYILKGGFLYWFNKQQYMSSDLAKLANGYVDLTECQVTSGPDTKQRGHSTEFNLTLKSPTEDYILTTPTDTELEEWLNVIRDAIRYAKKAIKERRKSLEDSDSLPELRGFLTKKGQKRYFILNDGILHWYQDIDKADKERGRLHLKECDLEVDPDRFIIKLTEPKTKGGRKYDLYAHSFQEADEWFFNLKLSIDRLNNPPLKRSNRGSTPTATSPKERGSFSPRGEGTDSFYDDDDGKSVGTRSNFDDDQSQYGEEEEDFEDDDGKGSRKSARSRNSVDSRDRSTSKAPAEKRGWLVKKGKPRFFILNKGVLVWMLNEPAENADYSKLIKGHLTTHGSSVERELGNQCIFHIKTLLRETYTLTAKSPQDAAEWVEALEQHIYSNPADELPPPTVDKTLKPLKKGYLLKKGQKRYFRVIVNDKSNMLVWFEAENSDKQKGSISLINCAVNQTGDPCSLMIIPSTGKPYILTAKDSDECSQWIAGIQQGIQTSNSAVEDTFAKTGWLEKNSQRRWFALDGRTLMWFDDQPAIADVTIQKANNSLKIDADAEIEINDADDRIFVIEVKKRKYELKANTPAEAIAWVEKLEDARDSAPGSRGSKGSRSSRETDEEEDEEQFEEEEEEEEEDRKRSAKSSPRTSRRESARESPRNSARNSKNEDLRGSKRDSKRKSNRKDDDLEKQLRNLTSDEEDYEQYRKERQPLMKNKKRGCCEDCTII
mmetsp:Transcript_25898/g.36435  ORF Transcript_25898/g.36435 Transcript_25898/m.36435 type:complete len:859 (-) Transcript_25898:56-2632(-)